MVEGSEGSASTSWMRPPVTAGPIARKRSESSASDGMDVCPLAEGARRRIRQATSASGEAGFQRVTARGM